MISNPGHQRIQYLRYGDSNAYILMHVREGRLGARHCKPEKPYTAVIGGIITFTSRDLTLKTLSIVRGINCLTTKVNPQVRFRLELGTLP